MWTKSSKDYSFAGITNQLPDAFTNNKKIVKSHIPATNSLTWVEVPVGQSVNTIANESKLHLTRGRLSVLKIKFLGREKYKKNKSQPLKRLYLGNRSQNN